MNKISIVVPCYNEEEAISIFYEKIIEISEKIDADFEYVFVDDGSNDSTLDKMRELGRKDDRVKFVSFSRNFGKERSEERRVGKEC